MPGNLPYEINRFVGRAAHRSRLASALTRQRLVTLDGVAGVGKTRLAVHTLHQLDERESGLLGEVCWADLGTLPDDRLLIATVADAAGFADHTPTTPLDSLCAWLSDRHALLVLDSCEHLLPACRSMVVELLGACPRLTVLATSREPFGLPQETVIDVAPLPYESEALALFHERAVAAAPAMAVRSAAQDREIEEICRLLDGLPLAIELASAQLRNHTPRELADRLRSWSEPLTAATPVWPLRHRSLRTAIGWSHELCAPLERLLWARLSVFRGTFDESSARDICSGGPLSANGVGAALAGLKAKSVIGQDAAGRYRLLDTVRNYGWMWLGELGERESVATRHAGHFLALARAADRGWAGPGQVGWYRRIAAAHTDLCAALDHLAGSDPRRAVELAGLVGFFWSCCGHLREARAYLEQTLLLCPSPGPERAKAQWALGVVVLLQGEHAEAARIGSRCARDVEHTGDTEGRLAAAYLRGITHLLNGEPHDAGSVVDAALRQAPGPVFSSAAALRCHLVKAFALTALGRLDEAAAKAGALRTECAARGECWTRSYADYQLALISLAANRPDQAAEHSRAMLEGKRRLGDSFGIALGMDLLAAAAAAQGHCETAALVSGTGHTYWRSVGHPQHGTPELRDVREECRRRARAGVGDQRFELAFRRGAEADPVDVLERAVTGRLFHES
ncbi:ATP-binding protein [Streptomyces sp. NPDC048441]|uniref:ATP-binding protein n=1 Tax=Streptomyces sp. NPDC048441 TaxID=3365552 RepID=UPI003723A8D4